MRFRIAIEFLILILVQNLSAQGTIFPPGAYMNYLELKSKSPSLSAEFIAERRTKGEIAMEGGSDYKIYSVGDVVSKKIIKKEIYAISVKDTLYINSMFQVGLTWYSKVISEGKYLVFYAPVNQPPGAGGAIDGAQRALKRALYVFETSETFGMAKPINQRKLENLLADYPSLLDEYKAEPEGEDEKIILKYLIKINELE